MSTLKCRGCYIFSGEPVEVEFDRTITHVDPILEGGADPLVRSRPPGRLGRDEGVPRGPGGPPHLAPGFIDLQVNGFAGVDYNSPAASMEDIGASIRMLFSTGLTRFFPTVITGDPASMLGAMRNLARARETLAEGPAIEAIHVEGPHISSEDGP